MVKCLGSSRMKRWAYVPWAAQIIGLNLPRFFETEKRGVGLIKEPHDNGYARNVQFFGWNMSLDFIKLDRFGHRFNSRRSKNRYLRSN